MSENNEDADLDIEGSEDADLTESDPEVGDESKDDEYIHPKKIDVQLISREDHQEIKAYAPQNLNLTQSPVKENNTNIQIANRLLFSIGKLLFCIKKRL